MEHYPTGHFHLNLFKCGDNSLFQVIILNKGASEIDYSSGSLSQTTSSSDLFVLRASVK